jgi:glycosyltransferase involved in cell wall biosynthesis
VTLAELPTTGGDDLVAKLHQVALVPYLVARLAAEMRRADAIHVRAPSNLGVLALPLAPLFSPRLHCKYAGMWGSFDGEPRSSRFQRRVLRSRWWRGPVSVYGRDETDPPHVLDAFSTALTAKQLERRRPRTLPAVRGPLRLLFVGRLVPTKNVDVIVEALARACAEGADVTLDVLGEGPALVGLVELSARVGVSDRVRFRGALSVDEVLDAYRGADVLALVSDSEGWPKVIVEAMAYGVVPIGNDRGLVPQIVSGGRGFTIAPRDVEALTRVIVRLEGSPELRVSIANEAQQWAARYSLEEFAGAFAEMLTGQWNQG